MGVRATIFAGVAIAMFVAAVPSDKAVIVNSGSTNSYGYTITVSSDGNGSITLQERGGASANAPKAFTVPAATTARFFGDLAAARKGNAATVPCMKSASFGSSMHITWQGWVSPDLTCPPKDALGDALVTDVGAIRKAAGIGEYPLRGSPPLAKPT